MTDTGFNWDASWTAIDAAVVQQEGEASASDSSATIDLDGKAACLISIDSDYGDFAKVTGGLKVYIARETGDGSFETVNSAWGFEMPFVQAGTRRKVFFLDASQFQKFQLLLVWANTTTDATVTSRTDIKYATIPVASA